MKLHPLKKKRKLTFRYALILHFNFVPNQSYSFICYIGCRVFFPKSSVLVKTTLRRTLPFLYGANPSNLGKIKITHTRLNWSGETECTRYNWIPTSAGNKRKSMPCYLWMNCTSCKMNMTLVSHKLCWTVRAVAVIHSDFYLQRLPACSWRRATAHTHKHDIAYTHTACMRTFHAVTQAWINKTHCLIQVRTTQEQMQSIRGGIFFFLYISQPFFLSAV